MKTTTTFLFTALLSTVFIGSASAQEEEEEFNEESAQDTAEEASSILTGQTSSQYKMGLSTTFPTGGDANSANILYALNPTTFLNLQLGVAFTNGGATTTVPATPVTPATGGDSVVGFEIGVGYRMYKDSKGKINPYLEPYANFSALNLAKIGDTLGISAGAILGFDYQLLEQFTIGAGVGAELNFINTFDAIFMNTFTTSINATFWWQ